MLIGNSSIRVVAALRSPHFCNDLMCYNKSNVTYFRTEPSPISLYGPLIKMPLIFIGCMGPSVSFYRPLIKIFLICIIRDLHWICLRGRLPKWNFKKAKRDIFQDQCIKEIIPNLFHDADDKMAIFSSTLLDISTDNIPKTSPFPKRKAKPWFDEDCQAAKKEPNKANRSTNKHHSAANSMRPRLIQARTQKLFKQKKRDSWKKICIFSQC